MKFIALIRGKEVPVDVVRQDDQYCLTINGKSFSVDAFSSQPQRLSLLIEGKSYEVGLERNGCAYCVSLFNDTVSLELVDARKYQASTAVRSASSSGPVKIQAPMPGKIVRVSVQEQARVLEGDSLLIMEAMKMQNELKAPRDGTISRIQVREGEPVGMLQVLMILE